MNNEIQRIIDELGQAKCVLGCFLTDGEKSLCSLLPEQFTDTHLIAGSRLLVRTLIATRLREFHTIKSNFHLGQIQIVTCAVAEHVFLAVLLQGKAPLPLADIYINIAIDELKSYFKEQGEGEIGSTVTVEDLMNGPMGSDLDRIEGWLSEYIGPAADIVMEDAMNSWIGMGAPNTAHLPDLFTILSAELGEEAGVALESCFSDLLDELG